MPNLTDSDKENLARIFRDVIFGSKTTDHNWDSGSPTTVKELWVNDISLFLTKIQEKNYDIVKSKINLDDKSKNIK